MKIVPIKGLWLLHWCTKFIIDISSRLWVIGVWNIENRTHMHTRVHTSGRQLKITFLDVLDYSEYSDANISKFFFSRKHSFLNKEAKTCEPGFRYCFLIGFTKFFFWESILLDFGVLIEEVSWIHRNFWIWYDNKKN